MKEFVPQNTCIWGENNKQILPTKVWQVIEMDFESDADILKWGTFFFLHDDTPTHSAMTLKSFLEKWGVVDSSHPRYSTKHAPTNFFYSLK